MSSTGSERVASALKNVAKPYMKAYTLKAIVFIGGGLRKDKIIGAFLL
jgi:hypothetical protein